MVAQSCWHIKDDWFLFLPNEINKNEGKLALKHMKWNEMKCQLTIKSSVSAKHEWKPFDSQCFFPSFLQTAYVENVIHNRNSHCQKISLTELDDCSYSIIFALFFALYFVFIFRLVDGICYLLYLLHRKK